MPSNIESIAGRSAPRGDAEIQRIAADAPLRLDTYPGFFRVRSGYVDLFAVPLIDGEPAGARRHVLRVPAGHIVSGLPATASAALIAVGGLETEIEHLGSIEPLTLPSGTEAPLLDRWIAALAEAAFGGAPAWPEILVQAGATFDCASGSRVHAGRDVLWVQVLSGSFGIREGDATMVTALPLAAGLFLRAQTESRGIAQPTSAIGIGMLRDGLAAFHHLAAAAIATALVEHDRASHRRLAARAALDAKTMATAILRLARVGRRAAPLAAAESAPAIAAFTLVADRLGVPISNLPRSGLHQHSLPQLARLTGFGYRRILLRDGWWRSDSGPLIGHRAEDHMPVALLPNGRGRYSLIDSSGERMVTPAIAAALEPEAAALYRPPPEEIRSLFGIARAIFRGGQGDLSTILVMGLLGSLLGTAVPIGTGFLFEWVVPRAELGALAAVIGGLVLAALGSGCFELVKGVALVRLESRMEAGLQPLIMQRLLSLPVGFFRNFGTGDLTDRVLAIQRIRHLIAGTTIVSLLAAGFAVVSLAVILAYSPILALLSIGLVGFAALVTAALGIGQLRHERVAVGLGGREDGLVLQFIQGISKLRVAAGETRMFGLWTEIFTRRRAALVKGQHYVNLRTTFYGCYPIIAALLLYRVAAGVLGDGGLSLGAFLAVSAAFGQLLAAMMAAGASLAGVLGAVPLFERLKPIVTAEPERQTENADPGPLTGAIEVSRLSFRYAADGPLVLDDISLRVEPGAFVAIVGASGSGKSTLQRLLLGFETAESGDILYQGQSIGAIDTSALRRRIGVVLQSARVMSGSIFENITAGLPYALNEAWEAARMAGIADDIEAMPMGMHSVLMEGASTLSGGQLQRLMIARALIGKPQVLILDEATSALDNVSQAVVTESLNRMHATRIVIAHRLSTIREADRIFVMDRGRLVETGTFDGLMAENGFFAALARRQLL
jgi:NHLM bacteriocin system ABC transporter ATP-binding protein